MFKTKSSMKWIKDNEDQLDKFTRVTPTVDGLVVEIGVNDSGQPLKNGLIVVISLNRLNIIDHALKCLALAQSMDDKPIKTNGQYE